MVLRVSELFGPAFGQTAIDAALDDQAWLTALCEVEIALARACTRAGLIDLATALEIGHAAELVAATDPADLGRAAVDGGNPVVPLVDALRTRVRERGGEQAAAAVHMGATSQDALDTATMLVTSRALGVLTADLAEAGNHVAALARRHRDTTMIARTLMQQALPTTFGALAAVWGTGLDSAVAGLQAIRLALPVSLGGPAGTLAALHPHGFEVIEAMADELDLAEPSGVWHADRSVIARLGGALGAAAVAIGKPATDIVLLAQTELGELREAAPGGSSSMPHKRNPIAAITARAGAAQAAGHVSTLLSCGTPELQRGAGPWHAERDALTGLLRCVGGAASRLRTSLSGLEVDADAMRRNLAVDEPALGHAVDLVDRYLDRRRA
ncbi:MAG: 3-carboxy-cis,cis-muconate cycloisomerase [Pseudonocardiales bacterium]|jgi:3-carboxy-cis,cis-muconate cycloisomerase|nr:3-carboxy-cis,cis-muconate cycloisomerase [Pseudonocardiales bacterium]